ncbi:DUF4132 domain-containing protein [Nocardia huaxiensis]|uniref:DUF4132 domain-containing protein n=1 Tax=Nocardia huaxiensis TaxID=2755382 RepID=A0A7D6Z8B8_9NOCA|nr:DUF4132 domain-containing protein [Nocardia huaxiensis]QLY29468.1 DUF4132 domain-containing protein [Nocardia huaxiensis]
MLGTDTATTISGQDEDCWEAPATWWELGIPARGIGPERPLDLNPRAAEEFAELVAGYRTQLAKTFDRMSDGSPELADAARTALTDPASCTPLGAALLTYTLDQIRRHWPGYARLAADSWVRLRGLAFAVEAAVYDLELRKSIGRHARWTRPYRNAPARHWNREESNEDGVIRLRAHLAGAPDREYAEAIARLTELRNTKTHTWIRATIAFLGHTERDWVAEAVRDVVAGAHHRYRDDVPLLLVAASVDTRDELETVAAAMAGGELLGYHGRPVFYAVLARFGPDCAGVVDRLLEHCGEYDSMPTTDLLDMLAQLPCDEAFSALLARHEQAHAAPALARAAAAFPQRALRLLAPQAEHSAMARALLRSVAHRDPQSVARTPSVAGLLESPRRTATIDELPAVLRTPPWLRPRVRTKPLVVADLVAPRPAGLAWAAGEREEWAQLPVAVSSHTQENWPRVIQTALQGGYWEMMLPYAFAAAPAELVRPLLATIRSGAMEPPGADALRRTLARFGDEAIPYVTAMVQTRAASHARILAPVTGTEVTLSMMRWLEGRRTHAHALAWFERHLCTALPEVIAAALTKPGKQRSLAECALRTLAARGHRDVIIGAAQEFGDSVTAAVSTVVDTDPLLQLPARIPALPNWLVPEALPPLLLRDRSAVLPADAARDLCTMLTLSGPPGDYTGVARVTEATDPDSLAEFAWGVFESWRLADYPAKDGWVLHALGLLGTDETARRLGPWIRRWPGQQAHARAVAGLDALLRIGSDIALMQLHGISERVKFKGIKTNAGEKIAALADELGLTSEELADRLVPAFGLDADGTLTLDYGSRGFVIGFDEQLKPLIFDAARTDDGAWRSTTVRKTLPKPAATDDETLAPAAYQRFAALKKESKSAAAQQIRRFERAMVTGRRWSAVDHRRLFVDHPLLWQVTRRLVWAVFDDDGAVLDSFRMAEDRGYVGASDDATTVAETAIVGIAHPVHLGDDLASWGEIFADYEVLQPFPQLQREILAFTPEERVTDALARFENQAAATGRLLGLTQRGWRFFDNLGGYWAGLSKDVGGGRLVVVEVDGGLDTDRGGDRSEQQFTVRLRGSTVPTGRSAHDPGDPVFGDLDSITASELLRDLSRLIG